MRHKSALQGAFVAMMRRPRLRVSMRFAVRALRLPEAIRQRLPVDGSFAFCLLGNELTYRSGLHDGVGRALFWARADGYEAETLDVLVRVLRASPASPTVFDVGANSGFYTLATFAVAHDARVHAFEPVAHVARSLIANVDVNAVSSRVHVNTCAVSAKSGRVAIHVPDETWGNATLGTHGFRGLTGHVEDVEAVSLDDYVVRHAIDEVDLVKIDVEGHEDAVLAGARRLLIEQRPAVLCECLPELDANAVNAMLADLGYVPYHLRESGPVPVASMVADPTGQFKNYLLLPAERPWDTSLDRADR